MNYQILDVTTGTAPVPAKLYTYFLDNSPEIDSKRTRPAIVLCPGGGYRYNALVEEMSLEHQVSEDTPPTFLWHTETDELVPVENSMYLFEALHTHHIPVEMHIYPTGEHGLSLANEETIRSDGTGIVPACQSWIGLAAAWVKRL